MTWIEPAYAIAVAAGLVVLSALFSATEVAMFSIRRGEREQMTRSGRRVDRLVLGLLAQPRKLISTVLIGNETVNATLVVVVASACAELPHAERPWAAFGYALAITLPLVVMLAEVLPKTLALKSPLAWARVSGGGLAGFAVLVTPVRWVVQLTAEVLLWPFGDVARPRPTKDLTQEEFRTLVDAGSAGGQVDARERRLIHRVFEFSDKNVGQVMTPRDKVFALSYDLPMARLLKEVAARGFSRVPIFQKSLDNVRGILNAKDLVRSSAGQTAPKALSDLLHEPLFVPRTTPVKRLFVTFKQKKVHMAIVVNEYGKVLGLVTMDDVLEQLFGAIRDEREALQGTRRKGRGGRTPVPGPGVETGPVQRVDLEDVADLGRAMPTPPPGTISPLVPVPVPDAGKVTSPSQSAADLAAAPVPITDADTGPSGPIRTAEDS